MIQLLIFTFFFILLFIILLKGGINMIGKPEWFERRKYLGWGIHPKTKEGWIYLLFIIFRIYSIKFCLFVASLFF